MRFASIVAMMVNLRRNMEKYPDPFPVANFLLLFGDKEERERQQAMFKALPKKAEKSWQELKAMGQFLARMYNAIEESEQEKRKKKRKR